MTAAEDRGRRDARAVELHLAGIPTDTIATQIGLSASRTRKLIAAALAARTGAPGDTPDDALTGLARTDAMLAGVWGRARAGNLDAVDRAIRLMEHRSRLAAPRPNSSELTAAFDKTVAASKQVLPDLDAALVAMTRRTMEHIDRVLATGTDLEVTKALYLKPHVMNGLREMLATPKARQEAGVVVERSATSRVAQLRAVATQTRRPGA